MIKHNDIKIETLSTLINFFGAGDIKFLKCLPLVSTQFGSGFTWFGYLSNLVNKSSQNKNSIIVL